VRRIAWPALTATAFLAAAAAATAHSPEDLAAAYLDREQFFQPIDAPAPEFALQDADGRAVRLADFRDKVVVLHFIYAGCPDVCPLHAERIAEVQALVNFTPMKDLVQFVTVTTDPGRDTADVLRAYGPIHGLDPVNWKFLTTAPGQPEDATRALAQDYGHRFVATDDGLQVHGVVTHIVDKQGRWRANFHGLRFAPVNLVTFVNALTNEFDQAHNHPEESWWDDLWDLF
jgi:protein SCO1/2